MSKKNFDVPKLYSLYSPKIKYTNNDFISDYMWHIHFPFLTLRSYKIFKVEEQQYFSQSSQFGNQYKQMKGGSIKALTENLQQLVQLIKVHLMPLLEEIKKSEFYYDWICKIEDNDKLIQESFLEYKSLDENKDKNKSFEDFLSFLKDKSKEKKKKSKKSEDDITYDDLLDYKRKRDEAVKHLKDKWVSEVDGGTMWTLQKQQSEKGLDMVLLPQLFFGVELLDPLNTNTLEKQLDEYIYTIDITEDAKRQVSRFLYRFHMWLPTAIRDTKTTFKLKISALKQFYSQIQMYVNLMKPLLLEISLKQEGYKKGGFYEGAIENNPDILNLFDMSYNFIRIFGIKDIGKKNDLKLRDLSYNDFGIYVDKSFKFISFGSKKDSNGYIIPKKEFLIKGKEGLRNATKEEMDDKDTEKIEAYRFVETNRDVTFEEFNRFTIEKKEYVFKEDLNLFPLLEMRFKNKRYTKNVETMQGPTQKPKQETEIEYFSYCLDAVDIISYKESIKDDNLELLSTFVSEIDVIREDLERYFNYFQNKTLEKIREEEKKKEEEKEKKNKGKNEKKESKKDDNGNNFESIKKGYEKLKELLKIIYIFRGEEAFQKSLEAKNINTEKTILKLKAQTCCIHDISKCYRIFKREKNFWSYPETR